MHSSPKACALNCDARDFVLATDLDGTFLGGSDEDRNALYGWIEENRETIGLIFVTGRDPEFIADICDGTRGVPWPDYVIGDVGTTIAKCTDGGSISPIGALEDDIARRWGDKGDAVRKALHGHPGLTLQPTPFRFRVSYDLVADDYHPDAGDKVAALGLDHLVSDNRFFDVLPKGVSKGPSLKRLVAHLGNRGNARAVPPATR
jgi:hydroxymethylpyrimidine pyrophosphatase-like HAD family hydrolase